MQSPEEPTHASIETGNVTVTAAPSTAAAVDPNTSVSSQTEVSSSQHTQTSQNSQPQSQAPSQSFSKGYLANRRTVFNALFDYEEDYETALPAGLHHRPAQGNESPPLHHDTTRAEPTLKKNAPQALHRHMPSLPSLSSLLSTSSQAQTRPLPGSRSLKRSASSFLRMAMGDDGKAKIVDRAVQSPSPERPKAVVVQAGMVSRLGNLRRSYSAAGFDDASHRDHANDASRKIARTGAMGRSKDSRTWEFWCDTDARSSLIERADQKDSGSAIEAIGQLKRSSSTRALQLNNTKLNSPMISSRNAGKPAKTSRQGLKRSHTHHGSLSAKTNAIKTASKKGAQPEEYETLNTESDKENWEPTKPSRPAQNTSFVRGHKRVLGENTSTMSQSSSLGSMMAREKARGSSVQSTVDTEISSFMGHGHSRTTSTGEDLDCVQSLLSLSQARWA